jgi:hypothetical protein
LKVIAPPRRRHSKELWALADMRASIEEAHLKASLFPQLIVDATGKTICRRPAEYDPPA